MYFESPKSYIFNSFICCTFVAKVIEHKKVGKTKTKEKNVVAYLVGCEQNERKKKKTKRRTKKKTTLSFPSLLSPLQSRDAFLYNSSGLDASFSRSYVCHHRQQQTKTDRLIYQLDWPAAKWTSMCLWLSMEATRNLLLCYDIYRIVRGLHHAMAYFDLLTT